jgi:hypothetical protein
LIIHTTVPNSFPMPAVGAIAKAAPTPNRIFSGLTGDNQMQEVQTQSETKGKFTASGGKCGSGRV